ncbi:MAG: M3 family oligoendopeptidase [Candidatus Bipolaricaulota bacterium]|nr:M3 family oligoendopeptidase [Candidatus Bipolaricaulota bacterium]
MNGRVYEQSRWSLADLISVSDRPEEIGSEYLDQLEQAVSNLETKRSMLSPEMNPGDFVTVLKIVERIGSLVRRLSAYGQLWFAEDTYNQDALSFRGRVESVIADAHNRALFFELWWKGLDDSATEQLLSASGDLSYYLLSLHRYKPYTLSEPVEKVINSKDLNGVDALVTLYEMLTSKFTFKMEVDGEEKSLTRSKLMTYARDPRPELRERAYKELYRVYGENSTVLGQIYQHVVRDWADEQVGLRGFSSPLSSRNLRNDVPDAAVDVLLDVCRDNVDMFQRYFRMKAGWLGMKRLRRYDIYAPLSSSEKAYPFNEAISTIFSSLNAFSSTLAAHAKRILDEDHLDSEVRAGKYGGAFCYGVLPGITPWVLTSYNGKGEDVSTLAHELGHAVHAVMAADHSPLTFHSSLPLAETASVFSEVLLLEHQLESESDPALRRDMLARFVDGTYATVARQAYFVLFEREAHALIKAGATTDALSERYLANLNEQFGDAVDVSDEFRHEWVSIPHIYSTPFYCYAYSFGQLLVLALYKRYKEEGKAFVPKFLKILSYGGSKSPQGILTEAGIDIASPAFWQGGFDVLQGMIDELEGLST